MATWKWIPNYEGKYMISDEGDVRSVAREAPRRDGTTRIVHEKILRPSYHKAGYPQVVLCKNGKTKSWPVHKLMAITWLGHVPSGFDEVVDHIDNNPKNNNLSNLQITTHSHNCTKDKNPRGYSYHKKNGTYVVSYTRNKKRTYVGSFETETEARAAYLKAISEI